MKRLSLLILAAAGAFAQSDSTPAAGPQGTPPAGQTKTRPRPAGLYAIFETSMGTITAKLYEKDVNATVRNFVELAQGTKAWRDPATGAPVRKPLYNGITFHRILPGIMIQSGDPTGRGTHDCGVSLKDEFLPGLTFNQGGKLAMANTGAPNSGGCQFFITESAMVEWDGKYTIFGQVVDGQKLVGKISHVPVHGDKPIDAPKLISVTIERVGPEPKIKKPKP